MTAHRERVIGKQESKDDDMNISANNMIKMDSMEKGEVGLTPTVDDLAEEEIEEEIREAEPKKASNIVQWRHGLQRILQTADNKTVTVPIYISLLLIASYILFGAVLFTLWEEDWDILIGSYFCFITLTTIGFGDYVPGTSHDSWASQEKLILCTMYLLFGLALIAMCFDLMQEEVRNKSRYIGEKLGLISKEPEKKKVRIRRKMRTDGETIEVTQQDETQPD